jgi:hypothetical protein
MMRVMRFWDTAGFVAAGLVVTSFCMSDIVPLRRVALGSSIAFLVYGLGLCLAPVWLFMRYCWRSMYGGRGRSSMAGEDRLPSNRTDQSRQRDDACRGIRMSGWVRRRSTNLARRRLQKRFQTKS